MKEEKRNQIILISTIIFLLFSVLLVSIMLSYSTKNNGSVGNVALKQIYSSDYELHFLKDAYFFGTYDNKINVIINKEGKEIFKSDYDIPYSAIYKLEDNNYLIYHLENNTLISYLFDGKAIKYIYTIENAENIKPIFYQGILLGFASIKEDYFLLYDALRGIETPVSYSLVGDEYQENAYINFTKDFLVVKDKKGNMGVIDWKGNLLIDCLYKNIIGTENNSFIALNHNDKYGILVEDGSILCNFQYNAIASIPGYYLLVNNQNKMALHTSDFKASTGYIMEYNVLLPYQLRSSANSIALSKQENKIFVINNKLESRNNIEYTSHFLYVIENNQVIDKISEEDVFITNYLLYKNNNKYQIYGNNNAMLSFSSDEELINMESLGNVLRISYLDKDKEKKEVYFNTITNSFLNRSEEELVLSNKNYLGFLDKEKKTFILTDQNGKEINYIKGNKIQVQDDYLIVDYGLYQIIEKDN